MPASARAAAEERGTHLAAEVQRLTAELATAAAAGQQAEDRARGVVAQLQAQLQQREADVAGLRPAGPFVVNRCRGGSGPCCLLACERARPPRYASRDGDAEVFSGW